MDPTPADGSLGAYLARREAALDWLAFLRRACALAGEALPSSALRDALSMARAGDLSPRLPPRDTRPLPLPGAAR